MERRDFIRWTGLGLLSLGMAGCNTKNQVETPQAQKTPAPAGEGAPQTAPAIQSYDNKKLVVSEGIDPAALLEKGFAAMGGIGVLIKKGSTVVVKPNFSVPTAPEIAATTKPVLVAALVRQCLAAGAKEVKVIDHPFTNGRLCLEKTEIKKTVEAAGGNVYVLDKNSDDFYQNADINGKFLKTVRYSKDVLNADVFINFPVLKHHVSTKLTMGLKNMMGLVWERGVFHSTDLLQTIAELAAYRKPHLTILDATRGITENGPGGPGAIRECNQLVFGLDPVAVDAYGAGLFGVNPTELGYLTAAAKLGLGEMDINKLTVVKA